MGRRAEPASPSGRVAPWLLGAALLAVSGSARAHDMWVEPSSFHPGPGELVEVRLRVGHPGGEAEPVARDPRRFQRFVVTEGGGETAVPGLDGIDPAGLLRLQEPGLAILLYQGLPAASELPAGRFEAYLAEEGLERVLGVRAARGERDAPGREVYSRCLKALVAVGAEGSAGDRPLGCPVELVAETPPRAFAVGAPLSVRLVHRGEGVPRVLVEALPLDGGSSPPSARTDAEGRVSFRLPRAGSWLVTGVHMVRARPGSGADWQSFWVSLALEISDGPRAAPRRSPQQPGRPW